MQARNVAGRVLMRQTTFVGDNGQPLRGPFTSTEWTAAAPYDQIARVKELGFNAVHLYAECFDPKYPAPGSKAPGYAVNEIDKIVERTRELGLYLVITIGNGANNGNHNAQWARDFWSSMHRVMQKKHMYCMKYTMSLWHGDLHIFFNGQSSRCS